MINKRLRRKIKTMGNLEELKEMIENPESGKFRKYLSEHQSIDDFKIYLMILRNLRIENLFEEMDIDKNELDKYRKKLIRLSPNSHEYEMKSLLFRKHNGNYKLETLLNQYHDSILKDGIIIGMDYGTKFIITDIQKGRFSKTDIEKMTENEINAYCKENRSEI